MKLIIPCYYSDYGRYINRLRSIPSYIDALKPVERRALLSLNDIAKKSLVKAAKVVGHLIGSFHPHGDASSFGTIIKMVENNLAIGEGNWGTHGLIDDGAAAMRYVECKIAPWVSELAFKYINEVPWENIEYEDEPLYLPSPIPIGLIGYDYIIGISFYRTVIPRYTLKDLAKRLQWLLDKKNYSEPIIVPNYRDCSSVESEPGEFQKILTTGMGVLKTVPYGQIDSQNNEIYILGRVPGKSFDSLQNAIDEIDPKTKKPILEVEINDESGENDNPYKIKIRITPNKKNIDLTRLANKIWNEYLIQNKSYTCYFSDLQGNIKLCGIDEILLRNYDFWKKAVLLKRWKICQKNIESKFENQIMIIIRDIIVKHQVTTVSKIAEIYRNENKQNISINLDYFENNNWSTKNFEVTENDIVSLCGKKTIRQLIEHKIDLIQIDKEIAISKNDINNIESDCFKIVSDLI